MTLVAKRSRPLLTDGHQTGKKSTANECGIASFNIEPAPVEAARASSRAERSSRTNCSATGKNFAPAGVSAIGWLPRSSSDAPSQVSRAFSRRLKAGCVTLRVSAAREKLPLPATARKSSSHLSSKTLLSMPQVQSRHSSLLVLQFRSALPAVSTYLDTADVCQRHGIDGKRLRGSKRSDAKPLHVLSAFAADLAVVIGDLTVEPDQNEITAGMTLLKGLPLEGSVITGDAISRMDWHRPGGAHRAHAPHRRQGEQRGRLHRHEPARERGRIRPAAGIVTRPFESSKTGCTGSTTYR